MNVQLPRRLPARFHRAVALLPARAGLGVLSVGGVNYNDTGDGITPENFGSSCCTGIFGTYTAVDSCNAWLQANASLIGSESPCSSDALANLIIPGPIKAIAPPPAPPLSTDPATFGQAVSFPFSVQTPACNGRLVVTSQDAADLITCIAQRSAVIDAANIKAQITANAQANCQQQAVVCAGSWYGSFVSVSSDCTGCTFSPLKPASLFLALGLVAGVVILAKVL